MRVPLFAVLLLMSPVGSSAQSVAPPPATEPDLTGAGRVQWVVHGNLGPQSLGVGVVVAGWNTAVNTPSEWHREWSGFGKRYVEREAHIALSNGIEAGLGAAWNEEPRYFRAGGTNVGARVTRAVRDAFVSDRRGRLTPAWGRYTGTVGSVLIENGWLPPSVTSGGMTSWRVASAYLGRAVGNLWTEFWPDVRDGLRR